MTMLPPGAADRSREENDGSAERPVDDGAGLVRCLTEQFTEIDGAAVPLFGGGFAIFGHG